ncbi:MAG: sensor histidine kinase [Planctomycetaceae bacterium]
MEESPQLRDAKLEAMAEFAAGAGHEINNPVATIAGRVQLLLRDETDPERRRALETIGGQALRIRDMIGDAMLFARPPRPEPEPLDLADVVPAALAPLQDRAEQRGCRFELEIPGPVPIYADRTQLEIVIAGLVHNSLEAMRDGGPVRIAARSYAEHDRRWARFTVSDTGGGLNEIERAHLFDPFFSGRQAGRGLGFGLSKCWRIVTLHGGRIDVRTDGETTTTFTIDWPADPSLAA